MTFYPDLSEYVYLPSRVRMWNVGWLDSGHPFVQGELEGEVQDTILRLVARPLNMTRGYHNCHFCDVESPIRLDGGGGAVGLGAAEIHVTDPIGRVFAAPDMVAHYITAHRYLPPREFVEAVEWGIAVQYERRNGRASKQSVLIQAMTGVHEVAARIEEVVRAHESSPDAPKLPHWFLSQLEDENWEVRPEVYEKWRDRSIAPEARQRAARTVPWGWQDWIEEMAPGRRGWKWVGARVIDERTAVLTVNVVEWPAPLTALLWLVSAAGGVVNEDLLL